MNDDSYIMKAEFNDKVCTYWLLSSLLVLLSTIVFAPLIIVWFPLGLIFTRRYLERMDCTLTDRALKVSKGILVRVEKTIPLEKITDMGMVEGPVMRYFGLHRLTIETAGQSGQGALVSLTGIKQAKAFREAVLNQRDAIAALPNAAPMYPTESDMSLLTEIRDALLRIENSLKNAGHV